MKQLFVSAVVVFLLMACGNPNQIQRDSDFNFNWQFSLEADSTAFSQTFDDSDWKAVNLPHDWSIEFPFDTINGEGCTGYLPGGTGWYRKTFDVTRNDDENISILFDGVYNNSEVWINGIKLGFHPYGYTPFYYNLTPHLTKSGKNNVIAVKVDRTRFADSRWYTGSGIYRNVKLIKTNKLHIPVWGTFISTSECNEQNATVTIENQLNNQYNSKKSFLLETTIIAPDGTTVGTKTTDIELQSNSNTSINQSVNIANPELWDVESPELYSAISKVIIDNNTVDEYHTTFGIRSIRFDADNGFFLNDKNMKIKGVCLHHDAGMVGAAVPKQVWRRRLQILKDGGCNAIRISHNPASDEFLELCDEMGFLVQDEFFDEWDYPKDKRLNMNQSISTDYITEGYDKHFQQWAERDLKTTILAHRNHPSIIQWSIGNEIEWTYPRNKKATGFWDADWSGNYFWNPTPLAPQEIKERYNNMEALEHNIGETAQKLSKWTKELDSTRPVVANCILPSASYVSGYADALDVIGFSYRRVMYDYGHKYFPDKPLMGTENLGQWHEWKAIMERPFVSGTFLWTGIDYMGEAHHRNPGNIRRRGTLSGLLDFAGFKKPSYFMMKSLWNDNEATLYMSTQTLAKSIYKLDAEGNVVEKKPGSWKHALWVWHNTNNHWNYQSDETVVVEIISNAPEVELFLNDKSIGTKKLADFEDRIYKWTLPFAEGKLEAKAIFNQKEVTTALQTATQPVSVEISSDKTSLSADGYDVAHVLIQLVDNNGQPVKHIEKEVTFKVAGDVSILGVDNGNGYSLQTYSSNYITTNEGKALLIVQSAKKAGEAKISAVLNNTESKAIHLTIK